MTNPSAPSWRTVAAEIIAATKADPDSLRIIYDDREFRPGRNASVWAQLSARLAQQRKAYREAVAKGNLKEVQHNMLRRCFAHNYTSPGRYMITMAVPQRGSNPFGTVCGDIRQNRNGITIMPEAVKTYSGIPYGSGPLRLELTPLGAAVLQALDGINANYPMVHVRKAQIMPDHLHLILEVTAPIVSSTGTPRHLGHVIAGFKKGCNRRYWEICSMSEPWNTGANAVQSAEPTASAERCASAVQIASAERCASAVHTASAVEGASAERCASSVQTASAVEGTSAERCASSVQTAGAVEGASAERGASSVQTASAVEGASAERCASAVETARAVEGASAERFSRSAKKLSSSASTGRPSLWAEGYTDTIILSRAHMETEEAYLDDNIYRLRMKQLHRDLFRKVHHISINGHDFAALGNIHLLRKAKKEQVQFHHWEQDVPAGYLPCDRSWHCQRFYRSVGEPQNTGASPQPMPGAASLQPMPGAPSPQSMPGAPSPQPMPGAASPQPMPGAPSPQPMPGAPSPQPMPGTPSPQPAMGAMVPGSSPARIYTIGAPIQGPTEAEAHTERLLKAGDEGTVFVSPFISETEKALRDAALTMGIPYIRLTREGFRDLYTPTKSEFEACCEGNLLILAPWEERKRTATITRRECMELNRTSQLIATDNLILKLINENNNDIIIPRDDE